MRNDYQENVFFMKQTVTNACATQAILSILFNSNGLEESQEFKNMKEFAFGLDYQTRGEIIGQSDFIR
jgi:ubiquitin carboxyl-terminal hydrolase L5